MSPRSFCTSWNSVFAWTLMLGPWIFAGTPRSAEAQSCPALDAPGRYQILVVPDTVDLVRCAELSIHGITRTCDPEKRFDTYFIGDVTANPPRLVGPPHLHGKYWESLALMRLMTGSKANTDVDETWTSRLENVSTHMQEDTVDGGRILELLALYHRLSPDPRWMIYGNQIVDSWVKTVVQHEDFAFFPPKNDYALDATGSRKLKDYRTEVPTGWPGTFSGWALQGLSVYYRETHYKPAGDLAGKLARYLRFHAGVFDSQGHFLASHDGYLGPKSALHFHHNCNSALALAEYALATSDKSCAEFARKSYEYARSVGNPLVGFFPEYIGKFPDDRHGLIDCEGCCVADMVALAIKLTDVGVGDYWEHVDCYVRNMFTEMQMKSSRWVLQATRNTPVRPVDPTKEDATDAAARMVGSFAGWSGPNQFRAWERGIMQCCLGNCARAAYYVWQHMLREEPDQVTIELMLNRVGRKVDVTSELPYAGTVRVHCKEACRVRLRRPSWLNQTTVHLKVNHSKTPLSCAVDGSYIITEKMPAGAELEFTFDLPERTIKTRVGHIDATLVLRGNEVVDFQPPGKDYPYWQDKPVSKRQVPEIERTYFIPHKPVPW